MNIQELRTIIQSLPRYEGLSRRSNAPIIHAGFPSCFNLSFGEYELIQEYNGQYLNYDHDLNYSKMQPCIRHQDWETIVNDAANRWRYLSLFDMADLSGLIVKQNPALQDELGKFAIKAFMDFIKYIGLNPDNLRISYFAGGKIVDATKGKYPLNTYVPSDPLKDYWKSLGIAEAQFIPDTTRDTFLALRIFGLPTPWGYRNEINYLHHGRLLDIGTLEYMKYQPVFAGKEIVAIEPFKHAVGISAIGIERVAAVLNDLDEVWEVDTIKPLTDLIIAESQNKNRINAMIIAQALRAIHRIVADGGTYKNLNTRRKEYLRMFYRDMKKAALHSGYELSSQNIAKILELNADLQPYYPELRKNTEIALSEIKIRLELKQ